MRFPGLSLALTVLLVSTLPALAHTGEGLTGGFLSGVTHPLFGPDHVVAMIAVGLWGAILGAPALWVLPLVFPLVMAFGGALGVLGIPVPSVEIGIAASGLVLGLLVALWVRAPIWIAAVIVGVFAIFHGHAHGTELPDAANPFAYAIGFVLATGALHMVGIALGALHKVPKGDYAIRAAGVVIALAGGAYLTGLA
jgi:urease accessory protein